MKPLSNYAGICLPVSEERFARECRSVFLVHSKLKDGPFSPVKNTKTDTFSRLREGSEPPGEDPLLSVSFRVVEMEFPLLRGTLSLGSSSSCDIQINDESISRHHANLFMAEGTYSISDNDSAMGTKVNGELLRPEEVSIITSGDRIEMGRVNFVFLEPPQFHRMVCSMFNR
ncbi:MAG: FHA domain-containing protein [Deltaproteobacteria bacterium]|nr:FHA domain-containing protein [Deltaproteobacteria bacterium]